jgi:hypothetical protein
LKPHEQIQEKNFSASPISQSRFRTPFLANLAEGQTDQVSYAGNQERQQLSNHPGNPPKT